MEAVWWICRFLSFSALALSVLGGVFAPRPVSADPVEYAGQQRSRAAVGHYSRARTMCVETLEEFEAGRKYARPDLMLDAEEWRLTLVSLCEQLNRLIDPKVKIDRGGIQVAASPRLIRREKDQLPRVADGPKDKNTYGDKEYLARKQSERARLAKEKPEQTAAKAVKPAAPQPPPAAEEEEEVPVEAPKQTVDVSKTQDAVQQAKEALAAAKAVAPQPGAQPSAGEAAGETGGEEEEAVEEEEPPVEMTNAQSKAVRPAQTAGEEQNEEGTAPPGEEIAEGAEGQEQQEEAPAAGGAKAQATEDEQIAAAIEDAIAKRVQELSTGDNAGEVKETDEEEAPQQ